MSTQDQNKGEAAAKRSLSMSEKITLKGTINISGVETNVVTMRRPRVKDRLMVERDDTFQNEADRELRYISNLCDLLPEDVENMLMVDYQALKKQLNVFTFGAV
jgi:hypothetical protein